MYADDVVLISKSERGLQKWLTKLENYCDLWCLDINIDKTKTIVFKKKVVEFCNIIFVLMDIQLKMCKHINIWAFYSQFQVLFHKKN